MASHMLRSIIFAEKIFNSSLTRLFINASSSRIAFHTSLLFQGPKGTVVKMPALSPTMTEGTIIKWLKKEGDSVQPGDALCDIQTDKAVIAMEVEEEGVLAKILMPNDSKDVKIGHPIAVMVEAGEDWKNVEMPSAIGAAPSPAAAPPPATSSAPPQPASTGPAGTVIKMPSLSPTMAEGTIVKWLLKEGDAFHPGDVLCEIQTDKAVVAMEVDEDGILAKILLPDDTKDVKIGTPIALMVPEGAEWKGVQMPADAAAPPPTPKAKPSAPVSPVAAAAIPPPEGALATLAVGPAVRNLLHSYNLSPDKITATGPHGKLLKGDVLKYIEANQLKPAEISAVPPPTVQPSAAKVAAPPHPAAAFTDIPHTSMRKTIAKRLTESKTTLPHAYATVDCHVDSVQKLRNKMKEGGKKVSVNDFIVKAAAAALQRVPNVNVMWTGQEAKRLPNIDISVAVATEAGLITPIVKNAIGLSIEDISNNIRDLAARARDGKLKPEEFMGGTFTISNLGMFGISWFSAIINPPQSAILAIGTSRLTLSSKKFFDEDALKTDIKADTIEDELVPCLRMTATLSYDSRAIDEDTAAQFLQAFRSFIETPSNLTSGSPISRLSTNQ